MLKWHGLVVEKMTKKINPVIGPRKIHGQGNRAAMEEVVLQDQTHGLPAPWTMTTSRIATPA